MGLEIYLFDGENAINEDSSLYPEHYYNKGFLVSAYNSSGYNQVVGNLIGISLYDIFDSLFDNEELELFPSKDQLNAFKNNAQKALEKIKNSDVDIQYIEMTEIIIEFINKAMSLKNPRIVCS